MKEVNEVIQVPKWLANVVIALLVSIFTLIGIIYNNTSQTIIRSDAQIQDLRSEVASLRATVGALVEEKDKIIESIRGLDGQVDNVQQMIVNKR